MLLTCTSATHDDKNFDTKTGVPQGGFLAPILFNFFTDDMIRRLTTIDCYVRAYAYDLVIYGDSISQLNAVMKLLEEWTIANDMKINKKKSGLLILRADKRTPELIKGELNAYPVLSSYKYLGIKIDNDVTLRIEKQEMRNKEDKLIALVKFN